jgi:hypothetical protein
MKIRDLLSEMPLNLNKDAPFIFNIDGFYKSTDSLLRTCQFLGEVVINNKPFKFWLTHNVQQAFITTIAEDDPELKDRNNDPTNLVVVELNLKASAETTAANPIQVDTVSTNSKFVGNGLASILYLVLARYGYSVISDYSQYLGGVNLWRKIARLSGVRQYSVKVWDIQNNDWMVDSNNVPIKYDEKNLDQDEVWNSIGQTPKTLLVLSSK